MRILSTAILISFLAAGCLELEAPPLPPPGSPDAGPVIDEPDATPVPVDTEPLAEWSGCMTLGNWEAAGMSAWANKATEGGTVCASCHGDGLARFNAHVDGNAMYQYNRYEVFITGFFTLSVEDGEVIVVPALDKLTDKGQGSNNHPTYITSPSDPYFLALEQFHQLTLQQRQAGLCGPASFPP